MPTISMFYGILIRMHLQTREHRPPHIHAVYGDDTAVFDILNAEWIQGRFPQRQRKLVEAWLAIHRDELLADWKLAAEGELPFRIDPLK
jgi:hypothetical protein